MLVEIHLDPACGWSQVAVRWLHAVTDWREVDVRLRPYSLLLRHGPKDSLGRRGRAGRGGCRSPTSSAQPRRQASWRAQRPTTTASTTG